MKIELTKKIGFFDVDLNNTIRPRVLMMMFQNAATAHSEKVGFANNQIIAQGKAWVLYQMGIHIHKAPALNDEVCIQSWHAKEDRLMAYRDYLITCENQIQVSARGAWLLIDIKGKKVIPLSGEISKHYTEEPPIFDAASFDAWNPRLRHKLTHTCSILLRPSDFDPYGHVNNTTYFEYLEIIINQFIGKNVLLKAVHIQYSKEIPTGTKEIQAGLQQQDDRYMFKLFSDKTMYAIGDFEVV